jgi:hypothetical protein
MQNFNFTLHEDGSNREDGRYPVIPSVYNTLSVHGDLNLTMLIEHFQQFVVGCGYVLPENTSIGLVED